jgi:hypothetical protein
VETQRPILCLPQSVCLAVYSHLWVRFLPICPYLSETAASSKDSKLL